MFDEILQESTLIAILEQA